MPKKGSAAVTPRGRTSTVKKPGSSSEKGSEGKKTLEFYFSSGGGSSGGGSSKRHKTCSHLLDAGKSEQDAIVIGESAPADDLILIEDSRSPCRPAINASNVAPAGAQNESKHSAGRTVRKLLGALVDTPEHGKAKRKGSQIKKPGAPEEADSTKKKGSQTKKPEAKETHGKFGALVTNRGEGAAGPQPLWGTSFSIAYRNLFPDRRPPGCVAAWCSVVPFVTVRCSVLRVERCDTQLLPAIGRNFENVMNFAYSELATKCTIDNDSRAGWGCLAKIGANAPTLASIPSVRPSLAAGSQPACSRFRQRDPTRPRRWMRGTGAICT